MTLTKTKLVDHTFAPWRIKGDARVVASEAMWRRPLAWNKAAAEARKHWELAAASCRSEFDQVAPYRRPRVFCASLADVFEDWSGPMANSDRLPLMKWSMAIDSVEWFDASDVLHQYKPEQCVEIAAGDVRRRLFSLIDQTPWLDWLLLTKRPENIAKMMPAYACHCREFWEGHHPECPTRSGRRNVWIGASVENQEAADKRIPHLLKVPAAVRFLSCEPLLGPVELPFRCEQCGYTKRDEATHGDHHLCVGGKIPGIDWVIVGGESGPGARPMYPDWARSIRDQCEAAGVPFFFKQHGEFIAHSQAMQMEEFPVAETDWAYNLGDDDDAARVGKKAAGRLLDGREWNEVPS